MVDKKNVLRLRRSRSVGFGLIGVMGFLIAGFVFQPAIVAVDNIAPFVEDVDPTVEDLLTIPIEEFPDVTDAEMQRPDITDEEALDPDAIEEAIEDQPNFEEPVSSNSTIPEQIGDENIENPISVYPTSDSIGLLVEIATIDSNGTRTTEEFRQQLVGLEFLGDPITGRDFSTGSIEVRMWLESEPEIPVVGTGFYDFTVNGQSVFGLHNLVVAGSPDQDGLIPIQFRSPAGEQGLLFIFPFAENLDRFPLNSQNLIEAEVTGLSVNKDNRDEFNLEQATVFTMDILNTDQEIIITNQDGSQEVLLPSDDRLVITAGAQTVAVECCGGDNFLSGTPHPQMGRVEVFDSDGNLIASHEGVPHGTTSVSPQGYTVPDPSVVMVDLQIARNSEYLIRIGEPTPIEFTLNTPISQKNYDFSCIMQNPSNMQLSQLWQQFAYNLLDPNDFPVECNMPLGEVSTFPSPSGVQPVG